MIYSLRGRLIEQSQNFVVVECSGVGYGVRTTMNTIGSLPKTGSEVRLLTHMSVREDAVELFGFQSAVELSCFRLLITVSGVGPKAALAILSELSPDRLMLCIASGDAKSITSAPGVGPKLASRIVLELKDKITNEDLTGNLGSVRQTIENPLSGSGEAVSALVALGYSQAEAAVAVARFPPDSPVQDIIKGALKSMSSR